MAEQQWLAVAPHKAHYHSRQQMLESNLRSYPRKLPLAIASASGIWVTDVEGKSCLASAGTLDLTTPLKDAFYEAVMALLGIRRGIDAWQSGFCADVAARGEMLKQHLVSIADEYPALAQVRGRGLMLGIEIVDERQEADHLGCFPGDASLAAAIQQHCFRLGLLLERGGRSGNVVRFLPPLIINEEECLIAVERFRSAARSAYGEHR